MLVNIPLFPLALLPLPGELVPLHIFEPRYKQLLEDVETMDVCFGIFCEHGVNEKKIGSLMKLESVIKRYPDGKSDIIVRCEDMFTVDTFFETYRYKLYPGARVAFSNVDPDEKPGKKLSDLFREYLSHRSISRSLASYNLYQIINELNLDISDRYQFMTMTAQKRQQFALARLKFQVDLLKFEIKSKEIFHLN